MALPTKEERIRRKKVMQDAGISVPNQNESWGPWWDEQWKKAITHTKTNDYYGRPSVWNLVRRTWNNVTGSTTYEAEPQPIGGTIQATDESVSAQIKRTLNNWQYQGDPARDIVLALMPDPSKPAKVGKAIVKATPQLIKAIPKLVTTEGVKKAGAKVAEAVIREVPRSVAGYAGGKGVDIASEAITGKSWSENVANKMSDIAGFHIEPIFGEVINPGYIGGYKLTDRAIRRAAFNQITPLAYNDKSITPLTKFEEGIGILKDIPKQLFNPKEIKIPAWRSRLESKLASLDWHNRYNPAGYDVMSSISNKVILDNREDALRLAFGLTPRTSLYIKNPNGTYRYNLDYVNHTNPQSGLVKIPDGYAYKPKYFDYTPKGKPYKGYGDNLAKNGGGIGYTEKDGVSYITDTWDLQPFKDEFRLPSFKGAKFMHKYLPDFEVLNALGGNPFTLEMTIPTYVDPVTPAP